jgi:hypothetical protein
MLKKFFCSGWACRSYLRLIDLQGVRFDKLNANGLDQRSLKQK